MLVSLTVGKVDAGVAVLLTEDKRLIEFPSILLPPSIQSGSVVNVTVTRNEPAEASSKKAFDALQSNILAEFGSSIPSTPTLRCRNATQTSVVLEWDPIDLATADLRSLTLYRKGNKAGNIPRPFENTSTKISGLAVDNEYDFQLVLRTSAGTYTSEKLVVRTHKMTDLSGITVTPGVMAPPLRESLEGTIERMGAKLNETVRIDTTHFVCTEGSGNAWEKALEMNVPVVLPDWVKGCEREGRIVGVRGYYLNADPKLRQVGPGAGLSRNESQQSGLQIRSREGSRQDGGGHPGTPKTEVTPPMPEKARETDDLGPPEEHKGTEDDHNGEEATSANSQGANKDEEDEEDEESEASGRSEMEHEKDDPLAEHATSPGSERSEDDASAHADSPARSPPVNEEEEGKEVDERQEEPANFDEVKL